MRWFELKHINLSNNVVQGHFTCWFPLFWYNYYQHWYRQEIRLMPSTFITGIWIGGGKVTRFPLGPLNVFLIISHWNAGKFSKQVEVWSWLSEWIVNASASWCDSTNGNSKKYEKYLLQNWNMTLLNLISLFRLSRRKCLYGSYWDPTPKRRVPWD